MAETSSAPLAITGPEWLVRCQRACDEGRLKVAVDRVYALANHAPPKKIEWFCGPVSLVRHWLAYFDQPGVGANITKSVILRLETDARKQLEAREGGLSSIALLRTPAMQRAALAGREIRAVLESSIAEIHVGVLPAIKRWIRRLPARPNVSDSSWTPYGDDNALLFAEVCGSRRLRTRDTAPAAMALLDLGSLAGWVVLHEAVCWVAARPTVAAIDESGRLHAKSGPALTFGDGWTHYSWKGVQVPSWIIEAPEKINVDSIDRQINPWIKRCMIDVLTPERYIAQGGALCVAEDETGRLWRRQWRGFGDDTWAAVEVVNGTAEPDGSFKHYFLQVPGHVRTAREAVAWTYGMTERQYSNLSIRT